MTIKRYALGVVVSTTCLVTGVLWYTRTNPDIRAEDVAACIAAGVERKWVTDWVEPPTNTVTAWMKASDLEQAADLLREALTDADVIYLDAGTWADGGLDMSYNLRYSGQCWELKTNSPVWDRRYIQLRTPDSTFVNGVALADRAMAVVTVTNSVTITTNQAYAIHTNLVIVAQTNTTGPTWADAGRTNGTVFRWNGSAYEDRETSYPDFPWEPISTSGETAHIWEYFWYWETGTGSPAGTYYPLYLDAGQTGTVEIAWADTYTITPLITTTTIVTSVYGGTNLPLYLVGPADVAAFTELVGGTNSWWAYAGFGGIPYYLQDVEVNGARGRYTVETRNLAQIRALATNLVRTVDYDFAAAVTNRTLNGYTVNESTNNNYIAYDLDEDAAYDALPGLILGAETTNAASTIVGVMASEDGVVATYENSGSPFTLGTMYAYQNRQCRFSPTLPAAALTNGYIARLRVYVAAETRSPYEYDCATNTTASTIEDVTFGENSGQTYGWDVDFGAAFTGVLPSQLEPPNEPPGHPAGEPTVDVGYLTTNQIWTLVGDVANPTTNVVFVIGPDDLLAASDFGDTPPLVEIATDGSGEARFYARRCETRIVHSALVIDWNFKVFGSAPYVPIETNRPAWMP